MRGRKGGENEKREEGKKGRKTAKRKENQMYSRCVLLFELSRMERWQRWRESEPLKIPE